MLVAVNELLLTSCDLDQRDQYIPKSTSGFNQVQYTQVQVCSVSIEAMERASELLFGGIRCIADQKLQKKFMHLESQCIAGSGQFVIGAIVTILRFHIS